METKYLVLVIATLTCASLVVPNKKVKITFIALALTVAILASFGVFN